MLIHANLHIRNMHISTLLLAGITILTNVLNNAPANANKLQARLQDDSPRD